MKDGISVKPVVLIPACNRLLGAYPFHVAGNKYVQAVRLAGCLPLVVPSIAPSEIDELLAHADGVFLTGSPSNVHPNHFGESVLDEHLPLDPERDGWTLPLIPRVLAHGIPLFAICRGFQEVNVALGGSLHQAVHTLAEKRDHRGPVDAAPELTYANAHPIDVAAGSRLAGIVGAGALDVNSVHGQGINRLATGLTVEARAPDGLIEAFSKVDAPAFNLCVQWHPEWRAEANPASMKLLTAFGDACRDHLRRRPRFQPAPEPDR